MAERLLRRCDAILRVGGESRGADALVELARVLGLTIYRRLADVPGCHGRRDS